MCSCGDGWTYDVPKLMAPWAITATSILKRSTSIRHRSDDGADLPHHRWSTPREITKQRLKTNQADRRPLIDRPLERIRGPRL